VGGKPNAYKANLTKEMGNSLLTHHEYQQVSLMALRFFSSMQ